MVVKILLLLAATASLSACDVGVGYSDSAEVSTPDTVDAGASDAGSLDANSVYVHERYRDAGCADGAT